MKAWLSNREFPGELSIANLVNNRKLVLAEPLAEAHSQSSQFPADRQTALRGLQGSWKRGNNDLLELVPYDAGSTDQVDVVAGSMVRARVS